MTIDLFDPDFYFNSYQDLQDAGLTRDEELFDHYITNGINEGRLASPLVDLNVYRASNPDLAAAGLTSNSQLLDHLENNGVQEGRRFSLVFDANYYRTLYADLQAAGLSNEQLYEHFLNNGIREGRVASANFDVNFYLNSNSDLRAAGFTNLQALDHFVLNGVREGRRGSATGSVSVPTGGTPGGGGELFAAADLGNLVGSRSASDFVGNADISDVYRFVLNSPSNFSLTLTGLTADADVDIIQDFNGNGAAEFEEIIDASLKGGTSTEAININGLAAGTYFARVFQAAEAPGDTNYNLNMTATPI